MKYIKHSTTEYYKEKVNVSYNGKMNSKEYKQAGTKLEITYSFSDKLRTSTNLKKEYLYLWHAIIFFE